MHQKTDFARDHYDVVVVGSGPNGLSAAIRLAEAGCSTLLIEAKETIGGGMRTVELNPGYFHDVCSSVHPLAFVSPYLKSLPLKEYGLEWIMPEASFAHLLEGEEAILHFSDVEKTVWELGCDGGAYQKLIQPFFDSSDALFQDILSHPLHFPKASPLNFAKFGLLGVRSASWLAKKYFKDRRTHALIAGCAAHSTFPLDAPLTSAFAILFFLLSHKSGWPIAKGGSSSIANAMCEYFKKLGGEVVSNFPISSLAQIPPSKVVLFNTTPPQMAQICKKYLSKSHHQKKFTPGTFKMDFALSEPVPWKDKRVKMAATIHLGGGGERREGGGNVENWTRGSFQAIAQAEKKVSQKKIPQNPFVLAVQPTLFDKSRAPQSRHILWAYCHTPSGSNLDMSEAIEGQIEHFAPGFKETILHKTSMNCANLEAYNPNFLQGCITGGKVGLIQTLFPHSYKTKNPHIFIASASTPPGAGVHGMGGFHAANLILKKIDRLKIIKFR